MKSIRFYPNLPSLTNMGQFETNYMLIILTIFFVLSTALLSISTLTNQGETWFHQAQGAEHYDAIVVFRNDDVSQLSDDFEKVNQVFLENEVPVSHGIVPKWFKENNEDLDQACEEFKNLQQENPELIEYSAHGYDHNGHEFASTDWTEIRHKVEDINDFFESCLNSEVDVFIPPQNDLSSTSRDVLERSNYSIVSGHERSKWQLGQSKITTDGSEVMDKGPLNFGQSEMMVSNWDTDPVTFRDYQELEESFENSVNNNQIHVQTIHYRPLASNDEEDKLEKLIYRMDKENIRFSSFEMFAEKIEDNRVKSVDDGWIIYH